MCGALCSGLIAGSISAQTVVEAFEYASDDELLAMWLPSPNAAITLSEDVASQSSGQKAMRVTFNFPSTAWTTELINGLELPAPLTIDPAQYVTLRIKGDPAFAAADFRFFYVYAYDWNGNFGRWGTAVPTLSNWQVLNFLASSIEAPWNSPGLPDLSAITRFAFYQYGSEAALPTYTATIELDDLVIRDEPLTDIPPVVESVVEAFEYADDATLQAAWTPSANTQLTLSTAVAELSPGRTALRAQFSFPSGAWATEMVQGADLANPVSIAPSQYVVLRLKGDPAFAAADFRDFYLYAYDASGNFGRWGAPTPTNSNWEVFNFSASAIAKPWDSPALPDLGHVVRFAIYQYGSETAIPAYTAAIEVDDIMVRNEPLIETPLVETVVNDFEYDSDEVLAAAWTPSANTVLATSDVVAEASSGQKSMSMTFTFPSGTWATAYARGPLLASPVPIAPRQYVTLRIQGDPAFDAADFKNFYVYAYDASGNFGRWGTAVPTVDDWQVLNFEAGTIEAPWDSPGLPDLGKIVRFSFFQYGSEAAIPDYTATVLVDDLAIRNNPILPPAGPVLAVTRAGNALNVVASDLEAGKVYELLRSPNFQQWTPGDPITATASTATWTVQPAQPAEFFRVAEKVQ